MTLSRAERLALVEHADPELPLTMQANLLSLNRAALYYRPAAAPAAEVTLKHRIDEIYTRYPFYSMGHAGSAPNSSERR